MDGCPCAYVWHALVFTYSLRVPASKNVPAETEWTLCSWGSCSFGCRSVAWWTRSPSWRECGDGLWFGWRCHAHSLRAGKREWATTRDGRWGWGGHRKKTMHDSTAASIHLADSFHLRQSSLALEGEKSIWRERLNRAVWQSRPLFTFWFFFFFLVCSCFFFRLSAALLETRCKDEAKQLLLYTTLHLLVNDILVRLWDGAGYDVVLNATRLLSCP